MTDNENKYWAFLSHSHEDNREQRPGAPEVSNLCWGDWLHDALKTFSIPAEFAGQINARGEIIPERIDPIFREEQKLPEEADLGADIRKALEQSTCLIVICSPRSAASLRVNEAVRHFKQLGRGKNILPIVIAGEPNAAEGKKPGISPADECFVPALRHPVQPDGTLDTTRRAGKCIFVDARHGVEKREILAGDNRNAEADLEMAKIQLIALLIGVGFNGLWWREQKRHFFDLAEAQRQVREALGQVAEVQRQIREAQDKALELQNLPRDVQGQIQEAQSQAREAQQQLQEFQNKVRETQGRLEEASQRALVAESKVLEAQQQAQEAQNKFLEAQSQAQEFQNQVRSAQSQLEEARQQVREAQAKVLEIQNLTRDAQAHIQEAQNKALEAQSQARTAQAQVQAIQNKSQAARRLTKVLALLAVLAALAASIAWWQRINATQALAKVTATQGAESGTLTREQIRLLLQNLAGTSQGEDQLRILDGLAVRIPTGEVSNTLAAAAVILDDPQRSRFQAQLLDGWTRTNASAAFDWSCQLTNVGFRQFALEKILPAMAGDSLTNTLARLNDLKPAPAGSVYEALFRRWAATDPIQAIEQRQSVPGQDADVRMLSAIMTVWVEQQPEAALKWLQSQPDSESLPAGTWRRAMIADMFDIWAAKDLEAATKACEQLPDGTKEMAWEYVLNQRIEKNPASAAAYVTNLPAGDYRQRAIEALGNSWDGTNFLAWAQSLPTEAERTVAFNRGLATLAGKDPQAASEIANQQTNVSGVVFGIIATVWFQRDFSAATNWVASLPEGEKKETAMLDLADKWAQSDPKGLVSYTLGLPAGDMQTRFLTAACRQLARRDLPGAVELLQPLADATLRQSILEQSARSYDLPHLEQAAKYIAAMPAGDDQKAAIKGLVSSWATFDPEAAVNWLRAFPETNSQSELAQPVIKTWSQAEPAVVAKWLANLPARTDSEGMVSAFLEGAVEKYPVFAWQWTQSVTDETKRKKYQLQVSEQWMKADPAGAAKCINGADVP